MRRPSTRRSPPKTPPAPAEAARTRRTRALEEPLDVRWIAAEPYRVAVVRNPLHGTRYRVFAPDLEHLDAALCTCPDFAHRGGETCKHLEAVRLTANAAEPPPASSSAARGEAAAAWAAIDRGRAARGGGRATLADLRREGRLLIDGLARPPGA